MMSSAPDTSSFTGDSKPRFALPKLKVSNVSSTGSGAGGGSTRESSAVRASMRSTSAMGSTVSKPWSSSSGLVSVLLGAGSKVAVPAQLSSLFQVSVQLLVSATGSATGSMVGGVGGSAGAGAASGRAV